MNIPTCPEELIIGAVYQLKNGYAFRFNGIDSEKALEYSEAEYKYFTKDKLDFIKTRYDKTGWLRLDTPFEATYTNAWGIVNVILPFPLRISFKR